MATKKVRKKAGGAGKKTAGAKKKVVSKKNPTTSRKPKSKKTATKKKTASTRRISKEQAEKTLRKGAERVTEEDVQSVLDKAEEIQGRFKTGGPLGKFFSEVQLLLALVRAYWNGSYREVPYWTIAAIVAALLYVINPFDLIPDAIPFVGLLDDAAVVAACISMVRKDLQRFEEWRALNG